LFLPEVLELAPFLFFRRDVPNRKRILTDMFSFLLLLLLYSRALLPEVASLLAVPAKIVAATHIL